MRPPRFRWRVLLVLAAPWMALSANAQPQPQPEPPTAPGRTQKAAPQAGSHAGTQAEWAVRQSIDGLDYPWALAQAGERLILTEAAGQIVTVTGGRLQRHPLRTTQPLVREGGGGLLGIALAPDFAQSQTAYLFHSHRTADGLANRVIAARFDGRQWTETRELLGGIPGHRLYNGGRLAVGPDGHLYISTGWAENPAWPQEVRSLAGKVLRLRLDGGVPADNPFAGSPVYSLGHRNPQGLAFSPTGELFVVEHGQSGHDEINRVQAGANHGWPLAQGSEARAGMVPAWIESGRGTWAPSGATFSGSQLVIAALGSRALLVADAASRTVRPLFQSTQRLRDVLAVGDDLWVLTTNRSPRAEGPSQDRLLRLSRTAPSE